MSTNNVDIFKDERVQSYESKLQQGEKEFYVGQTKMKSEAITPLPHDWTIDTWPAGLFPYNGASARHLIYVNQPQLLAAGALVRIGHKIVILAAGYLKWLASNASRVPEYDLACNRPEHVAKKFPRGHSFPRPHKRGARAAESECTTGVDQEARDYAREHGFTDEAST